MALSHIIVKNICRENITEEKPRAVCNIQMFIEQLLCVKHCVKSFKGRRSLRVVPGGQRWAEREEGSIEQKNGDWKDGG